MSVNVRGVTVQQRSLAVAVLELEATPHPATSRQLGEFRHFYSVWSGDGYSWAPSPRRRDYPLGTEAAHSSLVALERRGVVERGPRAGRSRAWKINDGAREVVREWADELPGRVT